MRAPRTRADWVLLVVGLVLAALGGSNLWLGWASRGWPTTEATIESSRVVTRSERVDPEVRFHYGVGGQDYTAKRIRFWFLPELDGAQAEHWVARYAAGAHERVAYHPDRPGLAVLAPGVEIDELVWLLAGLGMIAAATVRRRAERGGGVGGVAGRGRSVRRLVGLAGLAVLGWGIHDAELAWSSTGWPRAAGQVVHSATYTSGGGSMVSMWFAYTVNGVRFVCDRVRIGGNHTPNGDAAARIVASHPVGSAVEVAYDPDDPESAVLEPGLDLRHAVLPGIGLAILAGVAFVGVAAGAVERRNRDQTPSGDQAGHSGG